MRSIIVIATLLGGCASPALDPSTPPTAAPTSSSVEPPAPLETRKPNFSGRWALNVKMSDDPRAKLEEAMKRMKRAGAQGQMRRGTGGRGGGKKGAGGNRAGGGHAAPDGARKGRGMALEDINIPGMSPTLDIAHDDPIVDIIHEDGRAQRVYTDFRGATISASGSLQQQVTTSGWERGTLVVETTANNGQRLIQAYRLQADSGQLVVLTEIAIPQLADPVEIRQLYDPILSAR